MQIGFAGILAIVFIVLKLTEVITWSWIWVLSPLWVGAVLFLLGLILVCWVKAKESPAEELIRKYRSRR